MVGIIIVCKGVFGKILEWCKEREPIDVVSDGDWDGILATAIFVKQLKVKGIGVRRVSFPSPREISRLGFVDTVLIELPPSRGYRVLGENILIDHHGFTGIKVIMPDREEVLLSVSREVASVADLVVEVVGLKPEGVLADILRAVALIDQGRSKEDSLAWTLHRSYLYNVESQEFRQRVLALLIEEKFSELLKLAREEAANYDKAVSLVPEIMKRAIDVGQYLVSWYYRDKEERVVFREAMLNLEKRGKPVIMIALVKEHVCLIHIGSLVPQVDASKIALTLAEKMRQHGYEVSAGGKRIAAGIQVLSSNKPTLKKMIDIIKQSKV